jgi:hypothetical protein
VRAMPAPLAQMGCSLSHKLETCISLNRDEIAKCYSKVLSLVAAYAWSTLKR